MKRIGITLSAILAFAPASQAADLNWNSGPSPIYTPSYASSWSGFYAGVSAGYGWGTLTRQPAGGGVQTQTNTGGFQAGGQVGYNMDLGGLVLGGEADLHWTNIAFGEALAGGSSFKAGIDYMGTVRGRAGFSFGQVMPYVTAGLAAGRGSASFTDNAGVTSIQSATHIGWTVGGGVEAQISDNVSVRAEYLYVDLGTQAYTGLPAPVGNFDATQRFSVVRAGLNYKF